jgi:AcrR family transcriptional regulator
MHQLGLLMIERMRAVTARGPVRRAEARLRAIGRAYIEFALTEPGWFRTAFTSAQPHPAVDAPPAAEAPPGGESLASPFALLTEHLDELVQVGAVTPARRQGAEFVAWAAVHGISSLLLDGPLRRLPESEVEPVITAVLAGVNHGLYS